MLGYNYVTVTGLEFSDLNGEGTVENPYEILTKNDLFIMSRKINNGIGNYSKAVYSLKDNIKSDGITEIGNDKYPFKGTFEGNGYTITSQSGRVFGEIGKNGVVNDLKIDGAKLDWNGSKKSFAHIIANNNKGTVSSCSVKGTVNNGLVVMEYKDGEMISATNGGDFEIKGNESKFKVMAGIRNNYGFISIK